MAISELFRGFGVRVHTDDIDPVKTIAAINQYNIRDNVQVDREVVDGDIYAAITSVNGHDEAYEFTSLNVDDVLDVVGTTGICLKSDNTKTGFEFFLTALDQCQPGASVTANNLLLKSAAASGTVENYGLIWPNSLSIPHSGNATFSFNVTPRSDGQNAAVSVEENVSLPTIVDTTRRFGMGPLKINNTQYIGKQSIDVNFGVSILKEMTDGSIWPEWVALENVLAVITVRGINPKWALDANIPRGGRSFAHANTEFYARKKDPASLVGYVADNVAEHIKFTANGKAFITDLATGNATAPTQSSLVMYVEKDGSNAPLIGNTLQQIT